MKKIPLKFGMPTKKYINKKRTRKNKRKKNKG